MEKIVIAGGGGFVKCIINYIENNPEFEIVGYTDIEDHGEILGYKYLGTDDVLPVLKAQGVDNAVVGVGLRLNDATLKMKITNKLKEMGFKLPALYGRNVVVHRGAVIEEGVVLRDGCIVQAGTTIKAHSMIGDNCFIGHDTIIKEYTHIVAGSNVGRDCQIGPCTMVANNVTVMNGVTIGANVLIGTKSLVKHDCIEPGVYFGTPCKFVKSNEK